MFSDNSELFPGIWNLNSISGLQVPADGDPVPPEKWLNMDRAVASAIRKEHTWVLKQKEKGEDQLKKAEAALALTVPTGHEKRAVNEQNILKSATEVLRLVITGPKAKLQTTLDTFQKSGAAVGDQRPPGVLLPAPLATVPMLKAGGQLEKNCKTPAKKNVTENKQAGQKVDNVSCQKINTSRKDHLFYANNEQVYTRCALKACWLCKTKKLVCNPKAEALWGFFFFCFFSEKILV